MTKRRLEQILKQLIETPSVYPSEQSIGQVYIDLLSEFGFSIFSQDIGSGRKNLLATKGIGEQAILFFGHQDTVPVVNPEQWQTDPFKLVQQGGRLYGLGAADMKGGIAAFLKAVEESSSYTKILLSVDEENISAGAWGAIREKKSFFDDVELIISAESSFDLPLSAITTSRTGRCIFLATFEGKPEHIIRYKDGIDAIEKLGNFVSELYKKREKIFNSPDTVAQVRKIEGESVGMSVAANACAEIEVLLGDKDTQSSVQQVLEQLTDAKIKIKSRATPYLEAYNFSTFPYQEVIGKIIEKHTGQKMTLHGRKSVGDDNVLATLGIPVITWGPKGGNEHRPNEYVDIASLDMIEQMYQELLRVHGKSS